MAEPLYTPLESNTEYTLPLRDHNPSPLAITNRQAHDVARATTVGTKQPDRYEEFFSEFKNKGTYNKWADELSKSLTTGMQDVFFAQMEEATNDIERIGVIADFQQYAQGTEGAPMLAAYALALLENPAASEDEIYDYYVENITPDDVKALTDNFSDDMMTEYYGLMAEFGDIDAVGSPEQTAGYLAEFVVPGVAIADLALQNAFIKMVEERSNVEIVTGKGDFLEGEGAKQFKEWVAAQPAATRLEVMSNLVDFVNSIQSNEVQDLIVSDAKLLNLLHKYGREDLIVGGDPVESNIERFALDAATIADTAIVGWLLAKGLRGGSTVLRGMRNPNIVKTPTTRIAEEVNPAAATELYAKLLDDPEFARELNIDPSIVLETQFPRTTIDTMLDRTKEIPDFLEASDGALREFEGTVAAASRNFARRNLRLDEKATVVKNTIEELNDVKPVMITNRSRVGLASDDSGFGVEAVYGANKHFGYRTKKEALAAANAYMPLDGNDTIEIWKRSRKGGEAVKAADMEEVLNPNLMGLKFEIDEAGDPLLRAATKSSDEWFVVRKHAREWHPMDAMRLQEGDMMGMGGGIFKRGARRLFSPNQRFDEEIYRPLLLNFFGGERFVKYVQEGIRPFAKLSTKSQHKVHDMFEWYEQTARTLKKGQNLPDINDLVVQFPNATKKELEAFVHVEGTMKAMYGAMNSGFRSNLLAEGFVTFRNASPDVPDFHLLPYDAEGALRAKARVVWDPVAQKPVRISKKEIREMYAMGEGKLAKSKFRTGDGKDTYDVFIMRNNDGWTQGKLADQVLEYTPGYFPRLYKDPWIVVRRLKNPTVNGATDVRMSAYSQRAGEFEEAVAFSPSKKAAENKIASMTAKEKGKYEYSVVMSSKLAGRQRSAANFDVMRAEGRMFLDERNIVRAKNVYGDPARVENPIESLDRAIRIMANQLSLENTLRSNKRRFWETYKDVLPSERKFNGMTELKVAEHLKEQGSDKALEGLTYWNHLRMMGGYDSVLVGKARKGYLEIANTLDSALTRALPGRKRPLATFQNLVDINPLQNLRAFTFLRFMVLRPTRQMALQSMQAMMLAPLDPVYFATGKFVKDSLALRSGLWFYQHPHLRNITKAEDLAKQAKVFGVETEDFRAMLEALDGSGLFDTISIHSHAGGLSATEAKQASRVTRLAKTPIEAMQKIGFNFGERNNLTVSFLVALRKYMKEHNKTRMATLTRQDWDRVITRSSNYALGMVRPNNYAWQNGLLALPTQFMSFTVKYWTAMMGMNPSMAGYKNVAALWAGAYALWGTNIFGFKEEVQNELARRGIDQSDELVQILTDGFIDYSVNKSLSMLNEDIGRVPLGDTFAPGSATPFTIENIYDTFLKDPAMLAVLGPSEDSVNSVLDFTKDLQAVFGMWQADAVDPHEALKMVTSEAAIAIAKGWDDISQAHLAEKYGYWMSRAGKPTDIPALPAEVKAKGLFGMQPESLMNYYATRNVISGEPEKSRKKTLDTVAYDMYQRVSGLFNKYLETGTGEFPQYSLDEELYKKQRDTFGYLLNALPEEERIYVANKIVQFMNDREGPQKFSTMIADYIQKDGPPDKAIITRIDRSHLSEEDKTAAKEWVLEEIAMSDKWTDDALKELLSLESE